MPTPSITSESVPIFIPKLNCPSDPSLSDNPFVECLNEVDLGLSECTHSDDVGVLCEGINY